MRTKRLITILALWAAIIATGLAFRTMPHPHQPTLKELQGFHQAIVQGNKREVAASIRANPRLLELQDSFGSLLEAAAGAGHLDTAELLIDEGIDIDALDKDHLTALHQAALSGNLAFAKLLIRKGATLDIRDDKLLSTPLHWAAGSGRREMVALLIERGADVNARDRRRCTPLHWAVAEKQTATADTLRAHGGKDDTPDIGEPLFPTGPSHTGSNP